jgi:hypothetical protein
VQQQGTGLFLSRAGSGTSGSFAIHQDLLPGDSEFGMVCVHTYVYVCVHASMHGVYTYIRACVCMRPCLVCIHAYVYGVHTYVHACVCMRPCLVCIDAFMHGGYTHVRACVCMCPCLVCIHAYVHGVHTCVRACVCICVWKCVLKLN